jgi:hypothetical protein
MRDLKAYLSVAYVTSTLWFGSLAYLLLMLSRFNNPCCLRFCQLIFITLLLYLDREWKNNFSSQVGLPHTSFKDSWLCAQP